MLARYFFIGILNTIVHWMSFAFSYLYLEFDQGISNVIGFLISATLSYILNAKFNFKVKLKYINYFVFLIFLGGLSYFVGFVCDLLAVMPLFTLIISSFLNFILGFYFSKLYVFRGSS